MIRIGDGDEVRDVPHPLSPLGFALYDFALTDSFAIGSGAQRIRVYEVKVRPKDDRAAAHRRRGVHRPRAAPTSCA